MHCRLFLSKDSKSTQFATPSMSTVSTKEIAAIPQEQEPESISSSLESEESDPVSVKVELTSRSLFYVTTCTWPA